MLNYLPNSKSKSQAGVVAFIPLIAIAIIGWAIFVFVSDTAPFKGLFSFLFPKPSSYAVGPGVVTLDTSGQPITQTATANIKLQLTSPWNLADSGLNLTSDAFAQTSSSSTITVSIDSSNDDLSEINSKPDPTYGLKSPTIWLGNGGVTNGTSYTGLRFNRVNIPKGAKITSATVQFISSVPQWITTNYLIAADNSGNSAAFSTTSLPSRRALTSAKVTHTSNVNWQANTSYKINDISSVIQEVTNRSDWKSGNSLSVILKGTGATTYARKFVKSFDSGAASAPKLVITFTGGTGGVNPTIVPTVTRPTVTRAPGVSPTKAPTSIPTPVEKLASVTVAEDAGFTQNVLNVSPFNTNPMTISYTLSSLGNKTIYAKFVSSTGNQQVYQATINYASPTPTMMAGMTMAPSIGGESMAMVQWQPGAKNPPNPLYDKCDDGTDVSLAHKQYYVVAYDGIKYPTWHPPVVTNPITGVGKCYFGHEHGSDPQKYVHWNEIYQHFGKDMNGDGTITSMVINASTGAITAGPDRAGLPFGIANQHMEMYYNGTNPVDSIFVRHEDHVGHKIEIANKETDLNTSVDGNVTASTHQMAQIAGSQGLNIPYYVNGSETFQPTGVVCTHLHKYHQGTHSGDAIRNNLHEVIFHSECDSFNVSGINAPALYPNNTVLLTGMMSFGNPGEYQRFCFANRATKVCPDGSTNGQCNINDPLLSKMPPAIHSQTLGRNMVDRYCLDNWSSINPGNNYFGPYELWEGDLAIYRGNTLSDSTMIAEHGRQWDVLDPIRFVDASSPTGFRYNSDNCKKPGGAFDQLTFVGGCNSRTSNVAWDSPQSGFRGLKRTTYFGRNHISNAGGSQIYWTDPLGGNAVTTAFGTGLKQKISAANANIQTVQSKAQQLFGANTFLNDRAIQRNFNSGGNTVHAPN